MKYTLVKDRVFRLEKEARAWASEQKKKLGAAGKKYKIDINYLSDTEQWEAELFMKLDDGG